MLHTKIAVFDFITSIITINLPITCPTNWNADAIFTTELVHGARVYYNYKVSDQIGHQQKKLWVYYFFKYILKGNNLGKVS